MLLIYLQVDSFRPFVISSVLANVQIMLVVDVPRYLIINFVFGRSSITPNLSLVLNPQYFLVSFCQRLKALPTKFFQVIVVSTINSAGNWIICSYYVEGFVSDLPSFPLCHEVASRSIVVRMTDHKWDFMCCYSLELPFY